ncbi:cbb3-type cytochrome oxidase assembly protein CcoS [bacterium]|nr:cbb3-type cytochrome oxidase assembly protein CcoS [bacterium]
MDSLFILIPIAVVLTAVAIRAFFWTVDNKQYDDLDVAAKSILFDEVIKPIHKTVDKNNES